MYSWKFTNMAVINSFALYFSLLSVMMYASYKMNGYKCKTKTRNEKNKNVEKIFKACRGMYP